MEKNVISDGSTCDVPMVTLSKSEERMGHHYRIQEDTRDIYECFHPRSRE
jgi:hypothetical protein